jgi:hypothetical protein
MPMNSPTSEHHATWPDSTKIKLTPSSTQIIVGRMQSAICPAKRDAPHLRISSSRAAPWRHGDPWRTEQVEAPPGMTTRQLEMHLHAFETGSALHAGLLGWTGHYNKNRPHSAPAGRTPDEA